MGEETTVAGSYEQILERLKVHNKSKCLSSIYYMPGTFMCFNCYNSPLGYHYPQFTSEKGPERLKNLPNYHTLNKWQSQGSLQIWGI